MLEVEVLPELADKLERVITLDEAGLAMAALVPPLGGPSTVRLCQGIRPLKEPDSPSGKKADPSMSSFNHTSCGST